MKRIAIAVLLLTAWLSSRGTPARAQSCLDSGEASSAETALVVLSFATHGSNEALLIESVVEGDQRWRVRTCDDPKLLDRIKHGDKSQLDQLLDRKIVLVVSQQGASIRHYVIPYAYYQTQQQEVPTPQEFGMCQAGGFELAEACRRYTSPAHGLMAAAAALYKLRLATCMQLEDVSQMLNEALSELGKINDRKTTKGLRDFVTNQNKHLMGAMASSNCAPRKLNTELLADKLGAGGG